MKFKYVIVIGSSNSDTGDLDDSIIAVIDRDDFSLETCQFVAKSSGWENWEEVGEAFYEDGMYDDNYNFYITVEVKMLVKG